MSLSLIFEINEFINFYVTAGNINSLLLHDRLQRNDKVYKNKINKFDRNCRKKNTAPLFQARKKRVPASTFGPYDAKHKINLR